MSFLARHRGDTLRAYTQDLRIFLGWCADRDLEPLQAHLSMAKSRSPLVASESPHLA